MGSSRARIRRCSCMILHRSLSMSNRVLLPDDASFKGGGEWEKQAERERFIAWCSDVRG